MHVCISVCACVCVCAYKKYIYTLILWISVYVEWIANTHTKCTHCTSTHKHSTPSTADKISITWIVNTKHKEHVWVRAWVGWLRMSETKSKTLDDPNSNSGSNNNNSNNTLWHTFTWLATTWIVTYISMNLTKTIIYTIGIHDTKLYTHSYTFKGRSHNCDECNQNPFELGVENKGNRPGHGPLIRMIQIWNFQT